MTGAQTIQQGLAFDGRSLDALRGDASRDRQATVRKAAGQFEALFMQQLLKSMRDAMPKSGMLEGPGQPTEATRTICSGSRPPAAGKGRPPM